MALFGAVITGCKEKPDKYITPVSEPEVSSPLSFTGLPILNPRVKEAPTVELKPLQEIEEREGDPYNKVSPENIIKDEIYRCIEPYIKLPKQSLVDKYIKPMF